MKCPYKYLFGVPKKGFHSTRFLGIAMYDTLGTIVLGLVFAYVCKVSLWKSIIGMFVLGEVLHYVFGTQTAFLTLIGLQVECS